MSSTIGAGKSGAESRARFGPDSPVFWLLLGLLMLIVMPLGLGILLLAAVLAQVRRVRPTRMIAWVALATLAALALVGFNPLQLLTDYLQGLAGGLSTTVLTVGRLAGADLNNVIRDIAEFMAVPAVQLDQISWATALRLQLPLSLAVGTLLAAVYRGWAAFRSSALTDLEGRTFDATRPFGILDEIRRRISAWRIHTGRAARRQTVAVGTGRYGQVVNMPVAELQRMLLILGMIRSGKTAMALSLLGQAAHGGVIVIDFKGDTTVPEFWARWAAARGRKFKHFALADKNGVAYRPPVDDPAIPGSPACYDPLRHGNADSKTTLLQNSVDRGGDAAAYLRTASEFTLIAYQVAAITHLDTGRSGLQVLHDLCDPGKLNEAVTRRDPDTGQLYFQPGTNPQHASIMARVADMDAKITRDPLLRDSIQSTKGLLSSYMNGAAAGPWLRPGPTVDSDIDLVQAVLDGHVVVFSLPVQDYKELAKTLGTMVLLDVNNCISSLRHLREREGSTWQPWYLQIEEFGSAGMDAVLDVINKSGDVEGRPVLSSQSWHDLMRVDDGTGAMARTILDQAGNVLTFVANDADGAETMASLTPEVTKLYPRAAKEYRSGFFGILRAGANTGEITPVPTQQRQMVASDVQELGRYRRHSNNRAVRRRRFECVWIASYDGKRVTHTHAPYANHWVEPLRAELCAPDRVRFSQDVHEPVADRELFVAAEEVRRAEEAKAGGLVDVDPAVLDTTTSPGTPPPGEDSAPTTAGPARGRGRSSRRTSSRQRPEPQTARPGRTAVYDEPPPEDDGRPHDLDDIDWNIPAPPVAAPPARHPPTKPRPAPAQASADTPDQPGATRKLGLDQQAETQQTQDNGGADSIGNNTDRTALTQNRGRDDDDSNKNRSVGDDPFAV